MAQSIFSVEIIKLYLVRCCLFQYKELKTQCFKENRYQGFHLRFEVKIVQIYRDTPTYEPNQMASGPYKINTKIKQVLLVQMAKLKTFPILSPQPLLAGHNANGWQIAQRKNRRTINSSEARKSDPQSQKVQDSCINGFDHLQKATPTSTRPNQDGLIAATTTAPPQQVKSGHPQYNQDSDRGGTHIHLWAGYKLETKSEVVPNNITVSDPSIGGNYSSAQLNKKN